VKADPVQVQVLAHLETTPNSGHIHHDKPPQSIKLLPHHVTAKQHAAKTLSSSCFA
jgi:hypothetical protein